MVPKEIQSRCLKRGDMHGASFVSHKYVLVHFPKKKQNLPTTPLDLPTSTLHPGSHARVLGLILDSKLSWHPHIKQRCGKSARRGCVQNLPSGKSSREEDLLRMLGRMSRSFDRKHGGGQEFCMATGLECCSDLGPIQ